MNFTVQDLQKVLEEAIKDGHGSARILFDTEARTFEYYMAEVGYAYLSNEFDPQNPFIWLSEKK